jgi:hypothetical protein
VTHVWTRRLNGAPARRVRLVAALCTDRRAVTTIDVISFARLTPLFALPHRHLRGIVLSWTAQLKR